MILPVTGELEVLLKNKPGRVQAKEELAQEVLLSSRLFGFKDALSFRGKIAYALGQTFGHVLAPDASTLSRWAAEGSSRRPDEELWLALAHAVCHLEPAGPRRVGPARNEKPVLVFIDGACKEPGTPVGGLILCGGIVECFGVQISQAQVNHWRSRVGQKQVIGKAELFPILLAKQSFWKVHAQ